MKSNRFVLIYAIAVMLFFIFSAFMAGTSRSDSYKHDYSKLLKTQAAVEAPEASPLPEVKEAGYKDKSFATGVDSSPTLSVG
jgi:hypothetical protein